MNQETIHLSTLSPSHFSPEMRTKLKAAFRHRDQTRRATGGRDTDYSFAILDELEAIFNRESREHITQVARQANAERERDEWLNRFWDIATAVLLLVLVPLVIYAVNW